ncbi:MAG TPA: hypothetical protein VJ827_10380 [Rubrobacter sp.]|nr:hypothetical protein [Rubrobacter sp.]
MPDVVFERSSPEVAAALFDRLPTTEPEGHERRVSIEVRAGNLEWRMSGAFDPFGYGDALARTGRQGGEDARWLEPVLGFQQRGPLGSPV